MSENLYSDNYRPEKHLSHKEISEQIPVMEFEKKYFNSFRKPISSSHFQNITCNKKNNNVHTLDQDGSYVLKKDLLLKQLYNKKYKQSGKKLTFEQKIYKEIENNTINFNNNQPNNNRQKSVKSANIKSLNFQRNNNTMSTPDEIDINLNSENNINNTNGFDKNNYHNIINIKNNNNNNNTDNIENSNHNSNPTDINNLYQIFHNNNLGKNKLANDKKNKTFQEQIYKEQTLKNKLLLSPNSPDTFNRTYSSNHKNLSSTKAEKNFVLNNGENNLYLDEKFFVKAIEKNKHKQENNLKKNLNQIINIRNFSNFVILPKSIPRQLKIFNNLNDREFNLCKNKPPPKTANSSQIELCNENSFNFRKLLSSDKFYLSPKMVDKTFDKENLSRDEKDSCSQNQKLIFHLRKKSNNDLISQHIGENHSINNCNSNAIKRTLQYRHHSHLSLSQLSKVPTEDFAKDLKRHSFNNDSNNNIIIPRGKNNNNDNNSNNELYKSFSIIVKDNEEDNLFAKNNKTNSGNINNNINSNAIHRKPLFTITPSTALLNMPVNILNDNLIKNVDPHSTIKIYYENISNAEDDNVNDNDNNIPVEMKQDFKNNINSNSNMINLQYKEKQRCRKNSENNNPLSFFLEEQNRASCNIQDLKSMSIGNGENYSDCYNKHYHNHHNSCSISNNYDQNNKNNFYQNKHLKTYSLNLNKFGQYADNKKAKHSISTTKIQKNNNIENIIESPQNKLISSLNANLQNNNICNNLHNNIIFADHSLESNQNKNQINHNVNIPNTEKKEECLGISINYNGNEINLEKGYNNNNNNNSRSKINPNLESRISYPFQDEKKDNMQLDSSHLNYNYTSDRIETNKAAIDYETIENNWVKEKQQMQGQENMRDNKANSNKKQKNLLQEAEHYTPNSDNKICNFIKRSKSVFVLKNKNLCNHSELSKEYKINVNASSKINNNYSSKSNSKNNKQIETNNFNPSSDIELKKLTSQFFDLILKKKKKRVFENLSIKSFQNINKTKNIFLMNDNIKFNKEKLKSLHKHNFSVLTNSININNVNNIISQDLKKTTPVKPAGYKNNLNVSIKEKKIEKSEAQNSDHANSNSNPSMKLIEFSSNKDSKSPKNLNNKSISNVHPYSDNNNSNLIIYANASTNTHYIENNWDKKASKNHKNFNSTTQNFIKSSDNKFTNDTINKIYKSFSKDQKIFESYKNAKRLGTVGCVKKESSQAAKTSQKKLKFAVVEIANVDLNLNLKFK